LQALALKRLDLSAEGDARSSAPVDSVAKFAIEESIIKDISLNDRKAKAGAKWHQTRCHQRLFKKRVTTVYRRAIGPGLARLNHGRRVGGFDADVFRSFTDGRYVSSSQDVSLVRDPDLLKSLQNMMEELESSRQSRLRAWEALQKIRAYPKTADPSKINYVAAIPVLWVLVIYEASRPVISTQRWKSGME
jgi:hypothetical protein